MDDDGEPVPPGTHGTIYMKMAGLEFEYKGDEEWGEQIKAVVEAAEGVEPGPELAAEILASLAGRLAKMKWPKSIDFIETMPREPNGKLLKRKLRNPYWKDRSSAI